MIVPNGAILFLFVVIEFPSVHMLGDVSQKEMKNYYLCYGSTYADLTKASCDGNSRIVMKDILLGAKLKSSSCQPESSSNLNQSEYERCCSLSQNDCTGRMVDLARNYSSGDFYLACMGKSKCSHRQTPRSPTADTHCVNETDHLKYTNYMYFEYKCIQASRIGKLPWVDLSWQPHNLYLQYSDYENPASETQVPCVVCSVETSIGSVINITRLHIELAKHNAVCNQTITVIEQFNIKHIISCKDNSADNKFNLTTLYTSESNKIELVYNGEAFSKGNFWLEFTASPTGRLKITCPVESNTTICNPLKPTQKSISATDSKTKTSTIILAVVGSIVGVFVIIAIWKCTRKQKHKDKKGFTSDQRVRSTAKAIYGREKPRKEGKPCKKLGEERYEEAGREKFDPNNATDGQLSGIFILHRGWLPLTTRPRFNVPSERRADLRLIFHRLPVWLGKSYSKHQVSPSIAIRIIEINNPTTFNPTFDNTEISRFNADDKNIAAEHLDGGTSLNAIALHFQVHRSTISRLWDRYTRCSSTQDRSGVLRLPSLTRIDTSGCSINVNIMLSLRRLYGTCRVSKDYRTKPPGNGLREKESPRGQAKGKLK